MLVFIQTQWKSNRIHMQMCQVRPTEGNSLIAHSDCLVPVKTRNISSSTYQSREHLFYALLGMLELGYPGFWFYFTTFLYQIPWIFYDVFIEIWK
jgi:hypothetical protein